MRISMQVIAFLLVNLCNNLSAQPDPKPTISLRYFACFAAYGAPNVILFNTDELADSEVWCQITVVSNGDPVYVEASVVSQNDWLLHWVHSIQGVTNNDLTLKGGLTPVTFYFIAGIATLDKNLPPGRYVYGAKAIFSGDGAANSVPQDFWLYYNVTRPVIVGLIENAGTGGTQYRAGEYSYNGLIVGYGLSPGEIFHLVGGGFTLNAEGYTAAQDGKFPTSSKNVRVFFDDVPAPLLYADYWVINGIVPFSVDGKTQVSVHVETQTSSSAVLKVPIIPADVGIFTMNSDFTRYVIGHPGLRYMMNTSNQGAIVNEDGSFNNWDTPASKGSVVTLYGTGAGQTTPTGEDGRIVTDDWKPSPILPVRAFMDNIEAEVVYAGASVGGVAGLLRVDIRIPEGASSGPTIPIWIMAGDRFSQKSVTMAVQ